MNVFEQGFAVETRRTPVNKLYEVRTWNHIQDGPDGAKDVAWGQQWGGWWFAAPPAKPQFDSSGNITGSCEVLYFDGDTPIHFGSRDVRFAKALSDIKEGEIGITNAFESRLVLQQNAVTMVGCGGLLTFDKDTATSSWIGVPSKPGGASPYVTLGTGVAIVDSTGNGVVSVDAGEVVIAGKSLCVAANAIGLGGKQASDTAVGWETLNTLVTIIKQLMVLIESHVHVTPAGPSDTSVALFGKLSLALIPPLKQNIVKIPPAGV